MNDYKIGIGSTEKLSLRVSVGVLVKVLFPDPVNGKLMLALERTATLLTDESKSVVVVKAKPFGGGVRLLNPLGLKALIGEFHYDSERSLEEGDFRIQINPKYWGKIKEICKEHLHNNGKGILDPSPVHELAEEFEDSLKMPITPDKYELTPKGMLVEDTMTETENIHARGLPTVRVYYMFDAMLKDRKIIDMIIENCSRYSDTVLQKMAFEDAKQGGKGRANAMLIMPLNELETLYRLIPNEKRSSHIQYKGHQLDGNVSSILDTVSNSEYKL